MSLEGMLILNILDQITWIEQEQIIQYDLQSKLYEYCMFLINVLK